MKATYTEAQLAGFREAQRLAYACAKQVAEELVEGTTEREAARMLEDVLRRRGVGSFFHRPFAWFGTRATFDAIRTPFDFFPTSRPLAAGAPCILDVAPIVNGHTVDIGYSFVVGDADDRYMRCLAVLRVARAQILREVLAGKSMRAVYEGVDTLVNDAGFDNRHQAYPFAVLGHKVDLFVASPALARLNAFRFGPAGVQLLARAARAAISNGETGEHTPLWNRGRQASTPPEPGLWAIEPHIGRNGTGAKWEEILVVTDSTAYWLDDEVPHA